MVLACLLLALAAPLGAEETAASGIQGPFSHRLHVENGLECTDCHAGALRTARDVWPEVETCAQCHEEPRVAWTPPAPRTPQVVIFDHSRHAKSAADCAACHGDVAANDGSRAVAMPAMGSCLGCHEKDGKKTQCLDCHSTDWQETAPASHAFRWDRQHGLVYQRGPGPDRKDDCMGCHSKSESCEVCHQTEAPRSHTTQWRLRGHRAMADIEREKCATCHTADECTSCHLSTQPLDHRIGFSAPQHRHCATCHGAVGSSSCFICHKDGGNAEHLGQANPQPSTLPHVPGANCRACHAPGAGMVHPDPGTSCEACHM